MLGMKRDFVTIPIVILHAIAIAQLNVVEKTRNASSKSLTVIFYFPVSSSVGSSFAKESCCETAKAYHFHELFDLKCYGVRFHNINAHELQAISQSSTCHSSIFTTRVFVLKIGGRKKHDKIFQCTKNAINRNSTAQQIQNDDHIYLGSCALHRPIEKQDTFHCVQRQPKLNARTQTK